MKSWKRPQCLLLLISVCGALLCSCSTSTSGSPPTPTVQAVQTSCPAAGTARPAIMPPMASGSHLNILYLSEHGGIQTVRSQAALMRYDVTTHAKTTLLSFAHTATGISSAQTSPDGQWILFIATTLSANRSTAKLQLIRADGQMLQTLYCDPGGTISNLRSSPDLQQAAFSGPPYSGAKSTLFVLNLTTGQQKHVMSGNYVPYAWLDNTRLYLAQQQSSDPYTSLFTLFLLDTSKGANQTPDSLTSIASAPMLCGAFAKRNDAAQLLGSSCTPVRPAGCRGPATQGPSTLTRRPAMGGPASILYRNQTQAIMAFHSVDAQTFLLYIENTQGDLSQNGLWKINGDGTGLTRLTTAAGQACADLGYAATWPQIDSLGQFYALRVTDPLSWSSTLQVGSLTGGVPTTFETQDTRQGILELVGMGLM